MAVSESDPNTLGTSAHFQLSTFNFSEVVLLLDTCYLILINIPRHLINRPRQPPLPINPICHPERSEGPPYSTYLATL